MDEGYSERLRLISNTQRKYASLINRTRLKSQCQTTYSLVIAYLTNFLERFAFYSIFWNLVLFLTKKPLDWEFSNASLMPLVMYGLAYTLGLLGGLLGDSNFGKYRTIVVSLIVYIVGYVIFLYIAYHESSVPGFCKEKAPPDTYLIGVFRERCSAFVSVSVLFVGTGAGFFRANIKPFGAAQEQTKSQVLKYFNWHYWFTSLGLLSVLLGIAYLQQNVSFFVGYLVPGCFLFVAFILFFFGCSCYSEYKPEDFTLKTVFQIIKEARRVRKIQSPGLLQNRENRAFQRTISECSHDNEYSDASLEIHNQSDVGTIRATSLLDHAKVLHGGKFDDQLVEDVKSLRKLMVLFGCMIPFWIVYFQTQTTFLVQGLHMKLMTEGEQVFMVPAVWLTCVNHVWVVFIIPLLNCLYKRMPRRFNEHWRIMLGMGLSSLSVLTAGGVESRRLFILFSGSGDKYINQTIGNTTYLAADMTIAWQIPQYMLIGFGEVFCSVTCLYLTYTSAPKSMQSFMTGVNYFFMGVGSFCVTFIIWLSRNMIYTSRDSEDINCPSCHLDYYFYIMAGVQIFGIVVFWLVICKFDFTRMSSSTRLEESFEIINEDERKPANQTRPNSRQNINRLFLPILE